MTILEPLLSVILRVWKLVALVKSKEVLAKAFARLHRATVAAGLKAL